MVDSGVRWSRRRLARQLAGRPVTAHPVTRILREGDLVAGFEVLEVPGHSPEALACWRQRDRVLVWGEVLANFGLHPSRPRLVLAPPALLRQRLRRSARQAAAIPLEQGNTVTPRQHRRQAWSRWKG